MSDTTKRIIKGPYYGVITGVSRNDDPQSSNFNDLTKEFDFRTPAPQALPKSATQLAALMPNLDASDVVSIHTFDESSGDAIDHVGNNDLTYGSAVLRRQRAIGLPTGTSLIDKRCAEFVADDTSSDNAITLANPGFDVGSNSFAHLIVFRVPKHGSAGVHESIFGARDSSGDNIGYECSAVEDRLFWRASDGDTLVVRSLDTLAPGSWIAVLCTIDRVNDLLRLCASSIDGEVNDDIAGLGSFSATSQDFSIGNARWNLSVGAQVCYHVYIQGDSVAELTQDDLDSFWTLHSDPTGHLDNAVHNGALCALVGSGTNFGECWYEYAGANVNGRDQIPLDYSLEDGQLGLYCNRTVTNTLLNFDDLANWTTVSNITVTANAADSPRGFREAVHLDQNSGVSYITESGTCNASTAYVFSVALRTPDDTPHDVRLVIRSQDDTSAIAAQDFAITDQWQVVTLPWTSEAGQAHFHARIYGGTNNETGESYAWRPTNVAASALAATSDGRYPLLTAHDGGNSQTFYRVNNGDADAGSGVEDFFDPRRGEVLVEVRPFRPGSWAGGERIWECRRSDQTSNNYFAAQSNALETPRYIIFDDDENSLVADNADGTALDDSPVTIRYLWDSDRSLPDTPGTAQVVVDGEYYFSSPPTSVAWSTEGDDMTTHRFALGCGVTGGAQFPCSIRRLKVFSRPGKKDDR